VSKDKINLGKSGEDRASGFLKENGYKILAKNYRSRLGEIDIVAQDKDVLCFIEVKTRATTYYGLPQEAVTHLKQRQISKAALAYLKENNLLDDKARFDVLTVFCLKDGSTRFDLIQNAFELDKSYIY